MPAANTITIANRATILTGGVGTGKSKAALTFPRPIKWWAFEQNALAAIAGEDDVDYEAFMPEDLSISATPMAARRTPDQPRRNIEPRALVDFDESFGKFIQSKGDGYSTTVIDSTTTLLQIIMDRYLFLNGRMGKAPELQDYTGQITTFMNFIRMLVACQSLNIVLCMHTDFDKDEKSGTWQHVMSLTGKLKNMVPVQFSNVWHCESFYDEKDHARRFYIRTVQDRQHPFIRTNGIGIDMPLHEVTHDERQPLVGQGVYGAILQLK